MWRRRREKKQELLTREGVLFVGPCFLGGVWVGQCDFFANFCKDKKRKKSKCVCQAEINGVEGEYRYAGD